MAPGTETRKHSVPTQIIHDLSRSESAYRIRLRRALVHRGTAGSSRSPHLLRSTAGSIPRTRTGRRRRPDAGHHGAPCQADAGENRNGVLSGASVTAETTATDPRELIIGSAFACFRERGLNKTTVVDIARAADVSRSTVYEYFRDKAEIVEACAEDSARRFYREMARGMGRGESLEEKLTLAAVFVTRARRFVEPEMYFDADEVSLLLTKNAAVLLRECGEFLAPYLTAAKLTGEVRKDLDVVAAGEWFARMLFSLFSTPSSTLNMDDDEIVADFVRSHVVLGFTADRAGRAR